MTKSYIYLILAIAFAVVLNLDIVNPVIPWIWIVVLASLSILAFIRAQ